jgi:hypothetical protein
VRIASLDGGQDTGNFVHRWHSDAQRLQRHGLQGV